MTIGNHILSKTELIRGHFDTMLDEFFEFIMYQYEIWLTIIVIMNFLCLQETLVHPLSSEQPGFCRGFRKNLQGRWKRLVKRKPSNETYAIPPELRDQLKNIYVY